MRELSLYSGAGGGLLGTLLLGFKPVGYVEIDEYCQQVIAQRIKDGILPIAPIFGDVRKFLFSGAAAQYRGFVDVVTAGFPCQGFSVAGKRLGASDPRNMWPETIDVIRSVRPKFCFLENVRGLLSSGYFPKILKDLAESGYNARWRVLSARELGAPHKRERLWIVAYANREYGFGWCKSQQSVSSGRQTRTESSRGSTDVADTDSKRQPQSQRSIQDKWGWSSNRSTEVGDSTEQRLANRKYEEMGGCTQGSAKLQLERPTWWEAEPDVGRLVDRFPYRVDELKAIGNAQVPAVVAKAWELLTKGY